MAVGLHLNVTKFKVIPVCIILNDELKTQTKETNVKPRGVSILCVAQCRAPQRLWRIQAHLPTGQLCAHKINVCICVHGLSVRPDILPIPCGCKLCGEGL